MRRAIYNLSVFGSDVASRFGHFGSQSPAETYRPNLNHGIRTELWDKVPPKNGGWFEELKQQVPSGKHFRMVELASRSDWRRRFVQEAVAFKARRRP